MRTNHIWLGSAAVALVCFGGGAHADTKLTMEEISVVTLPGSDEPQETRSEYTLWLREDRAARVNSMLRVVVRLDEGVSYFIDDARQQVTVREIEGLPEAIAGAAEVTRSGQTRTIGAWDAEHYAVRLDGTSPDDAIEIELWVSDDVDFDMERYRAFSRAMDGGTGLLSAIADLPGYPVLQEAEVGVARSTTRLLAVAEESPPSGIYDIPARYDRQ